MWFTQPMQMRKYMRFCHAIYIGTVASQTKTVRAEIRRPYKNKGCFPTIKKAQLAKCI